MCKGVRSLCDCNRSLYTLGNAISKMKIPELTEYELEEEGRVRELDYLIYMINAHAEK